jgi:hypothetical protein
MGWKAILIACVLTLFVVFAGAAAKGKISFSGSWILTNSKVEQSSAASGPNGVGIGGVGGRRTNPTGGGGTIPGGRNPGGGRRGGPGGENPEEAAPQKDSSIIIEHSDTEMKVIHKVNGAGDEEGEFIQIFKLDGSESVNQLVPHGGELRSRTSWEKDKLVTLGTQKPPGSDDSAKSVSVVKQEFTLSKDGKTMTRRTSRSTPRGKILTVDTFTRQADTTK